DSSAAATRTTLFCMAGLPGMRRDAADASTASRGLRLAEAMPGRMHRAVGPGRRLLERVRQLQADDVDVVLVRAADQTVGRRASRILVDVGILDENIRPREIQRDGRRVLVLSAKR